MKPKGYLNDNLKTVSAYSGGPYKIPLYRIPKGYKLVPIEPSNHQLHMMEIEPKPYLGKGAILSPWSHLVARYKAGIKAAPDIEDIDV